LLFENHLQLVRAPSMQTRRFCRAKKKKQKKESIKQTDSQGMHGFLLLHLYSYNIPYILRTEYKYEYLTKFVSWSLTSRKGNGAILGRRRKTFMVGKSVQGVRQEKDCKKRARPLFHATRLTFNSGKVAWLAGGLGPGPGLVHVFS
jgi:hypothetical protein